MSEDNINNDLEGSISNENPVSDLYEDWFLDYASYVILERAIPKIDDGLKPVQRRLLFSMREMHDGRYHKVANIIGRTMQYHPHGDQAIGDALVVLGQKNLLIDKSDLSQIPTSSYWNNHSIEKRKIWSIPNNDFAQLEKKFLIHHQTIPY